MSRRNSGACDYFVVMGFAFLVAGVVTSLAILLELGFHPTDIARLRTLEKLFYSAGGVGVLYVVYLGYKRTPFALKRKLKALQYLGSEQHKARQAEQQRNTASSLQEQIAAEQARIKSDS